MDDNDDQGSARQEPDLVDQADSGDGNDATLWHEEMLLDHNSTRCLIEKFGITIDRASVESVVELAQRQLRNTLSGIAIEPTIRGVLERRSILRALRDHLRHEINAAIEQRTCTFDVIDKTLDEDLRKGAPVEEHLGRLFLSDPGQWQLSVPDPQKGNLAFLHMRIAALVKFMDLCEQQSAGVGNTGSWGSPIHALIKWLRLPRERAALNN